MADQSRAFHDAPAYDAEALAIQPPNVLWGRAEELKRLRAALESGPLVLHGPAGIGKTALAAALAAEYASGPGGVLWLSAADDGLLSLLNRIARAYGEPAAHSSDPLPPHAERVKGLLSERRPLLVLDDVGHFEAARGILGVVGEAPLIITQTGRLEGPSAATAVAPLKRQDALTMLSMQADAEDGELETLGQRLGGHPFALTIAASQLATGTAAADVLRAMPSLPAGNHNTAMAILLAAYRLLPPDLQGTVMLVGSAFGGLATEGLLAASSGASPEALSGRLRMLGERGWVALEGTGATRRYRTHELVRVFSAAFLRAKGRLEALRARHLEGIIDFVLENTENGSEEEHQRLAAVWPALLASAVYAARKEKYRFLQDIADLLEPQSPASYVAALGLEPELEWLRTLADEPAGASHGVLAAVSDTRLWKTATAELSGLEEGVAESTPSPSSWIELDEPSPIRAETPSMELERPSFDTELARPPMIPEEDAAVAPDGEAAARAARAPLDVPLPEDMHSLERIGYEAVRGGDPVGALGRYAEALQGYQADGNVADELAAIEALAMISLESDAYDDVLKYVDQGMTLAQQTANPQREGQLLLILGDLQAALGRYEGAEVAYREAISAFRPSDAWLDIGLALDKLGGLYLAQGRQRDAVEIWQQTLPIFERVGRRDLMRGSLDAIGEARAELMQWDRAASSHRKALELADEDDDRAGALEQLSKLGQLYEARGQRDQGIRALRRALQLTFDLDRPSQRGYVLMALARLMIDDTASLNRVVQVLNAAAELLPDNAEVQRLLSRAVTRRERLMRSGMTLPVVEGDLKEFARAPDDEGS